MDLCETNIYGTFNCIQKFSKLMTDKGINGSIINIGLIYGVVSGDPRIYTDTKEIRQKFMPRLNLLLLQMTKYLQVLSKS